MPFEFTVGEEPLTAGEPLTVQCGVSEGDMPITFRWTFHGQELSSQMGIATMRINSRVSLLSIDSIAAGHAGDYTCTAQNSAGQVNHTAVLLVQGFHFFGFSLAFFFLIFVQIPTSLGLPVPLNNTWGRSTPLPQLSSTIAIRRYHYSTLIT